MPTAPDVDAWLIGLNHPQKDVIDAVRSAVLASDPRIVEGIKWNAGSFRTTEWFATFNVHGPMGPKVVGLVLHLGAKVRARGVSVADPAGLLTALGKDRALVTFADLADVEQKAAAFDTLLRAWIAEV